MTTSTIALLITALIFALDAFLLMTGNPSFSFCVTHGTSGIFTAVFWGGLGILIGHWIGSAKN